MIRRCIHMPTTVHIPAALLKSVDRRAKALGLSRNRLIVRALERAISDRSGWAPEFLEQLRSVDDETATAVDDLLADVKQARRSKPPTTCDLRSRHQRGLGLDEGQRCGGRAFGEHGARRRCYSGTGSRGNRLWNRATATLETSDHAAGPVRAHLLRASASRVERCREPGVRAHQGNPRTAGNTDRRFRCCDRRARPRDQRHTCYG